MNIFVLTGAGISAESGLGVFRDKSGPALWKSFDPRKLATPEAFADDPALVHDFYNARRRRLLECAPNAAHHALATLEKAFCGSGHALTIVTQNIDDLHERAGSGDVIHMHGELLKVRCRACHAVVEWREDLFVDATCEDCGVVGSLRPHVVWFGEAPLRMDEIYAALSRADLFVAIGTSGSVYPAARFVEEAREAGVRTCEINLTPSDNAEKFDERRYGKASETVPIWSDQVLASVELAEIFVDAPPGV